MQQSVVESKPSPEANDFVMGAAHNCVVKAKDILAQKGIWPDNPNLSFYGNVIAADMAHYWESGFDCHAYHVNSSSMDC